eukprot:scaffold323_cov414-Prasinococcus_capsulatus_cf.AAC.8
MRCVSSACARCRSKTVGSGYASRGITGAQRYKNWIAARKLLLLLTGCRRSAPLRRRWPWTPAKPALRQACRGACVYGTVALESEHVAPGSLHDVQARVRPAQFPNHAVERSSPPLLLLLCAHLRRVQRGVQDDSCAVRAVQPAAATAKRHRAGKGGVWTRGP